MKFGLRVSRHVKVFGAATIALGVPLAPAHTQAQAGKKIMLVCTYIRSPNVTMNVTIDYAANTVVTSQAGSTAPIVDDQGHTAKPAQVSQSAISWRIAWDPNRCNGACIANYDLNRLTGNLMMSGNNGAQPSTYNCAVGAPKF
ncbi:MAG TPA: hypothetical protein VNF99_08385 [Stellaceae bacterium]|nr:hypothetical protein [Stellaceae bacterium]